MLGLGRPLSATQRRWWADADWRRRSCLPRVDDSRASGFEGASVAAGHGEAIRRELVALEQQMQAFIAEEMKKQSATQTLDNVLIETVVEQARAKGFAL